MSASYTHDILIIGAGPAGSACALALKDSGLKTALLDKARFPRDKVCGDAIPGRAVRVLREISLELAQEFDRFPQKCFTARTEFFVNHHKSMELRWVQQAYTCARLDFDNQLVEMVQAHTDIDFFQETMPTEILQDEAGVTVCCEKQGLTLKAPLIIGCDGAHSIVRKTFTGFKMDLHHYGGAVRAYYKNVKFLEPDKTEVYVLSKYLPGYFWVFPLPGNRANAGFGMLSKHISEKRLNLKKLFFEFIAHHPLLKEKFATSEMEGTLQGFGLPFGSQKVQVSGERFMLTGDAASLIDPATGDGIGNAMWSGQLAARQAQACFEHHRFDVEFMKAYEKQLYQKLWPELRKRALAQRVATRFPWMLDVGVIACQNSLIKRLFHKVM